MRPPGGLAESPGVKSHSASACYNKVCYNTTRCYHEISHSVNFNSSAMFSQLDVHTPRNRIFFQTIYWSWRSGHGRAFCWHFRTFGLLVKLEFPGSFLNCETFRTSE